MGGETATPPATPRSDASVKAVPRTATPWQGQDFGLSRAPATDARARLRDLMLRHSCELAHEEGLDVYTVSLLSKETASARGGSLSSSPARATARPPPTPNARSTTSRARTAIPWWPRFARSASGSSRCGAPARRRAERMQRTIRIFDGQVPVDASKAAAAGAGRAPEKRGAPCRTNSTAREIQLYPLRRGTPETSRSPLQQGALQ